MAAKKADRAEWSRRVEEWRRSGLDLRAFAVRASLSLRTLSWWRWRLESEASKSSTALMPLSSSFVELEAAPIAMTAPFEIVLVSGRIVRVPVAFDDAALSRLLGVVDGAA
jgi:hypothetical protein